MPFSDDDFDKLQEEGWIDFRRYPDSLTEKEIWDKAKSDEALVVTLQMEGETSVKLVKLPKYNQIALLIKFNE